VSRNVLPLLVLLSWASSCYAAAKPQKSSVDGTLTGVVMTEDGRPADNFNVCTQTHFQQGFTNGTSTCCQTTTDHDGRFTINHLKPGTYEVLATNNREGYSIENQSPGQKVTVSEKDARPQITIHLHNRGAVVLGSITDKATGKIIHNAQLAYITIDCGGGGNVLQDDGQYYVLAIPVNCDAVVIATAKGYKGWVYADPASRSRPVLSMATGQRRLLNIELERLPKVSAER